MFDSVVQGGDSVWEGLRVYSGKIFKLDEHLDRLVNEKRKVQQKVMPSGDTLLWHSSFMVRLF